MDAKFQRIALIGKYRTSTGAEPVLGARAALQALAHFVRDQGFEVVLESASASHLGLTGFATLSVAEIGQQCDLALVVGGDGTMLGIGRQLAEFDVPLIGINQGRLGFITDIAFDNFATCLSSMLHGAYVQDQRCLISSRVLRCGRCVYQASALNDVVLNRGATSGMVELRVQVDGHFVANQRADGLIIATPTGATAYALSAGGPLLHPSVAGWVMVPIAPHTLSNRPIVLSDSSKIEIEIVGARDANASFDQQSLASLKPGDCVEVSRSEHRARFLHPVGWSYFDTLREKMHWNEKVIAT